jgi:rSAM/selenodomain-associated transferase 1
MSAASSTPVVVAMLKAPRAGFVKTRLALEIGSEPAVAIYRLLVEHQMSAIPRGWRVEVHFAPADAAADMQQWLGLNRAFYPQVGDDLGERLIHATGGAFSRGSGTVVVIGGDCPGLDETCLRDACCALESAEVVLGPAVDGGYYLIGLRRWVPELFRGIPWSSDAVLRMTLERVREARLSIAMLPTKEDVDDLASWRRAHGALPRLAVEALRPA